MFGLNREIVLRRLRKAVLITVAWASGVGVVAVGAGAPPQLRYVFIISRHGVCSPMWTSERLNQYAAEPWPEWGVPPGNLTRMAESSCSSWEPTTESGCPARAC